MATSALWIGGPPGSGKTTVARSIARRYGLRWYSADAHTWEHRDRAIEAGNPDAIRWEATPPEQRWSATTAELLAMSLHRERATMIVEDVGALPASPLTIAEGTPVMPAAAGAGDRAVWLLPTTEVQRARLAKRGLSPGVLRLYRALVREIEQGVEEHGAQKLYIDAHTSVEDTVAHVERLFAAALDEGPTATTTAERRRLLRYANRAIVSQYRAYASRPWTPRTALATVRQFACECGRDDCDAQVELAIADFPEPPDGASPPVLAPGHSLGKAGVSQASAAASTSTRRRVVDPSSAP